MIVRRLQDILGTDADVRGDGWSSRRLLFKDDGMGYSVNDTLIHKDAELELWYKNHLEAVYCIEGRGQIKDLTTGELHEIEPGTIYALNNNDRHILMANKGEQMRMVCVFNPPLTGRETHDEDGSYNLSED